MESFRYSEVTSGVKVIMNIAYLMVGFRKEKGWKEGKNRRVNLINNRDNNVERQKQAILIDRSDKYKISDALQ